MSDFEEQLKARLERARQRVSELSEQVAALEQQQSAAETEVATWEEALLAERRASGKVPEADRGPSGPPLRQLSLGNAVLRILQRAGGPMHVKDILRELGRHNYAIGSKNPISAIVTTLTRRKQFKRVAPNTFALVEGLEEDES